MTALLCKNILIRAGVEEKICAYIKNADGSKVE